jgi:hypothetical protein
MTKRKYPPHERSHTIVSAIFDANEKLTYKDVFSRCPNMPRHTVRHHIASMLKTGEIESKMMLTDTRKRIYYRVKR